MPEIPPPQWSFHGDTWVKRVLKALRGLHRPQWFGAAAVETSPFCQSTCFIHLWSIFLWSLWGSLALLLVNILKSVWPACVWGCCYNHQMTNYCPVVFVLNRIHRFNVDDFSLALLSLFNTFHELSVESFICSYYHHIVKRQFYPPIVGDWSPALSPINSRAP